MKKSPDEIENEKSRLFRPTSELVFRLLSSIFKEFVFLLKSFSVSDKIFDPKRHENVVSGILLDHCIIY